MDRTPLIEVRRILRKEVGFGCPVIGCGRPYLTWHHFDPPWSELNHHNPEGMVALCQEHHDQADAGAFTKEQLRAFKESGSDESVTGKFNWLRKSLIFTAGSCFIVDPFIFLRYKNTNIIGFTRDEDGYLLLNINFINGRGQPRFQMIENFWNIIESPSNIDCPPSGKLLDVKYSNGDRLKIEFSEIESRELFKKEFKSEAPPAFEINYPVTLVRVYFIDTEAKIKLTSTTTIPGWSIKGLWAKKTMIIFNL